MAVKNLTEKMVARTPWTAPGQKRIRISDAGQPYLKLIVGSKSKTFYWEGQSKTLNGRATIKLGAYPDLNLAEARAECRKISESIRKGIDPRTVDLDDLTGSGLAQQFYNHPMFLDLAAGTAQNYRHYLGLHFEAVCGTMSIKTIHSGHLMDVIDIPLRAGQRTAARQTWTAMSRLFKFAILKRLLDINPMYGIPAPRPSPPRDRVLTAEELRVVWKALGSSHRQSPQNIIALRLLMLLPLRRSELLLARWDEIDWAKGNWTIPAHRIKTRSSRPGQHLIPLTPLVIELLKSLRIETGASEYLFPASKHDGPIDPKIMTRFVARSISGGIFKGMENWTIHDLRRTIATGMGMLRVEEAIISRCLNHSLRSITSRVYNLHAYRDEKLEALQTWEDYLMGII